MSTLGKLTTFDTEGETHREREVAFWNVFGEPDGGVYVSLGPADLSDSGDDEYSTGIVLDRDALNKEGFFEIDRISEEQLLDLGYIRAY